MKLVILGRDGVINRIGEGPITSPESWEAIPGSLEAVARLNHAGYTVALATNQPAIADGELDLDKLNLIHGRMYRHLTRVGGHLDGIFFCPHDPEGGCDCHKPRAGLPRQIMQRFDAAPEDCVLIGDSIDDVHAARACAVTPLLVRTGHGMETEQLLMPDSPVPAFDNLAKAVEHILAND